MKEKAAGLLKRYSAHSLSVHGIYWPVYGTLLSFTAVILLSMGFTNTQIGVLVALGSTSTVLVQQPVAAFADHSRKVELNRLIAVVCLITLPFTLVMLLHLSTNLIVLGFVFWVTYVGIMMLQSLLNAMGMEFVNRGYPVNYGRCRGIGALLCAFAIWGIGRLEESTVEVSLLVFSVGLFLIAVTASCFRMPPRREAIREVEAAPKKALLSLFRKYPFFLLFSIGVMLNQASYNISGIYLIHVVTPLGGGNAEVGLAMALSACAEFLTMNFFLHIARHFRMTSLLRLSCLILPLKPITFALASAVGFVYFAQLFHILGVALFLPSSVYYINMIMRAEDRAQGQAIVVGATVLAIVLASVLGGWGVDRIGVVNTLWYGNVLAVLGGLIVFFTAGKVRAKEDDAPAVNDTVEQGA